SNFILLLTLRPSYISGHLLFLIGDIFLSLFKESVKGFDLFDTNSFSEVTSSTEPSIEEIEFHVFFCLHFDISFVESFEV
ncbi:hypothetical protein A2U01_0088005, partial [Trifolium medium]|nr:hypothetical protein [Trifolium medium]